MGLVPAQLVCGNVKYTFNIKCKITDHSIVQKKTLELEYMKKKYKVGVVSH